MKSIIDVIEFMETLEEDEDDKCYKAMMEIKKDLKEQVLELLCSEYKENYKKKKEEKNKKKQEKEKYIRLQKEREEQGEVCVRCCRRDCCC